MAHLPLHAGRLTQKYRASCSESSPLLLTEGGPEGAGCGGDPVRSFELPGKTIRPTSVSPKGLPPSPQGEGFSQKPLPSTPNDRTLPQSRASPCQPPLGGGQGPGQNLWPLPPLIRPLCGHLPPGEGSPQKGRQPSTKSNRTPPPSPSVTPPPTRRGYPYSPPGRYKLPFSLIQRCHFWYSGNTRRTSA